ncbi:3-isopropylmalate dehydrogenase [Streptomyces noursei]|uniref:3-isopropylmalate dehydrogenase n=1 Tax=Streptomyces noursei TaxID=1971 RepID=UPI00069D5B5B|nr:3-isopropylmalate dehydrogenase [Streptomyces noursei]
MTAVSTSPTPAAPTDRPRIVALPGDGIGPEVVASALQVLHAVGDFEVAEHPVGAAAIDRTGQPLPPDTLAACAAADAVLLGAVGTGHQPADPDAPRPEQGVLELRAALGLYANLRPVRALPALAAAGPLKPDRTKGVDLIVVRELTGGLYFGRRARTAHDAYDTCTYTVTEIERVTRVACELASRTGRRARVTSVDKANVLDTSRLWRETVTRVVAHEYPHVALDHLLVDTAAMRLVTDPASFDVILTENMFGDILSDETAAITGSLGLLPSASLPGAPDPDGGIRGGLFEPVHGSAPDIAGRGQASPLGTVLSVALMLRHGLGRPEAADAVEAAVERALDAGLRTPDLGGSATTDDTTRAVLAAL